MSAAGTARPEVAGGSSRTARLLRIATPEGVGLPFEIGGVADRLAAFVIDAVLVHVGVVVVLVLGGLSLGGRFGSYALSAALLASFLLRNLYFTVSELRLGGATPGKRRLGLRVIARDGGPLGADAVIARNLTRELEVFLPLVALAEPEALLPGLPRWGAAIGMLWVLLFGFLPLLNRERLRVGDLIGGTVVVRMPRTDLREDLAASPVFGRGRPDPRQRYRFTRAQLDLYGIHELQTLEQVLRRGRDRRELLHAVARRIKKKIGWPDQRTDDAWVFLSAFYAAQRGLLEHRMLFGERRERKK